MKYTGTKESLARENKYLSQVEIPLKGKNGKMLQLFLNFHNNSILQ